MAWAKSLLKGAQFGPAEVSVSSDALDDFNALVLARVDVASRGSDVTTTAIWTDQAAGSSLYHVKGCTICTVRDGVSSTLPAIVLAWTDSESNTAVTLTLGTGSSADAVGTIVQGGGMMNLKAGTSLTFTTATYASNTGARMKFVAHVVVERL